MSEPSEVTETTEPLVTETTEVIEPTATAPAAPAKPDRYSRALSIQKQKERELRKEREALIPKLQKAEAFENLVQEAKKNPWGLLSSLGLTTDDLVYSQVTGKPKELTPEERIAQLEQYKLDREKAELEYKSQQEANQKKQQATEAANQYLSHIDDFVSTYTEQFPLVAEWKAAGNDANEIILNTIKQYFAQTGEVMSTKDAVNELETYLDEVAETKNKVKTKKEKVVPKDLSQSQPAKPVVDKTPSANPGSRIEKGIEVLERLERERSKSFS